MLNRIAFILCFALVLITAKAQTEFYKLTPLPLTDWHSGIPLTTGK
jgi:hypothetical protein